MTSALPTESVENNPIRRQEEDIALVVAPILDGKIDTWKAWIAELNGARSADLKDMNQRMGLTRHAAWLAETHTDDRQSVTAIVRFPADGRAAALDRAETLMTALDAAGARARLVVEPAQQAESLVVIGYEGAP